jgi:hypothetical protein
MYQLGKLVLVEYNHTGIKSNLYVYNIVEILWNSDVNQIKLV